MQVQVFSNENRDYHPELLLQPEDVATVLVTALTLPHTAEVTEIRMRPLAASY
jgi:NADP-dependent 3-hydroxy acid dehydrogenase YdfG